MQFSKYLINGHYNSTFKYHNSLDLIGFGKLIIYNCQSSFGPGFEVLKKNNPLQINISANKRGNGDFFHSPSLITTLFKA